MTDDEIIDFWTIHRLRRWSQRDLDGLPIKRRTLEFLRHVGMPLCEDWTMLFDPHCGLPELQSRPGYRVLGYDDTIPICIDPGRGDAVVAVEDSVAGERRERYMNRDPRALAATLVAYEKYRRAVIDADDAKANRIIDSVHAEMAAIDASAFEDREHYWPVMIEQMRHGLI